MSKDNLEKLLKNPKVKTWLAIQEAHRAIFSYLDGELQKKNCNVSRFQILFNLYFNGAITPVNLARHMRVSRANITTFIKRLKSEEIICEDLKEGTEKRPAYKLTPQGERYFEKIFPEHISNVQAVLEALDDPSLEELSKMAQKAVSEAET